MENPDDKMSLEKRKRRLIEHAEPMMGADDARRRRRERAARERAVERAARGRVASGRRRQRALDGTLRADARERSGHLATRHDARISLRRPHTRRGDHWPAPAPFAERLSLTKPRKPLPFRWRPHTGTLRGRECPASGENAHAQRGSR